LVSPGQTLVLPPAAVIAPGTVGAAAIFIVAVREGLVPQELFAVTEMVPPAVLLTTVMELVVEVPVHPPGNCHV
jgi:hypothetical protein